MRPAGAARTYRRGGSVGAREQPVVRLVYHTLINIKTPNDVDDDY